ncbi:hypothetical protein AVEN_32019-1 [Araneus ventricosus]|uniref:YqaJ viral recombinase domain-containing protein n=1 Tax=Araneus ventricosus TaxID=182803 RepID=A0A4Y2RGR7_ARAVE|nr:hypothetical protein AVEN_32019-1 [Araneus ventricosus]
MLNRDSSVKSMWPHCSGVQLQCSRAQCNRALTCTGDKGTQTTGRRTNNPPSCSLRDTVWWDMGLNAAAENCDASCRAGRSKSELKNLIVSTLAMKYGLANEENALKQYEEDHCIQVQSCGLFVHPNKPFLYSSPDGLIGDDGVLEIKCPYSGRFSTNLAEFITDGKYKFGVKISNKGEIYLPESHKFYYQIQGQLFISNRKWCDLYVWCKKVSNIYTADLPK